jgi:hypothetical protein
MIRNNCLYNTFKVTVMKVTITLLVVNAKPAANAIKKLL